jgi:hypothetical protein
MLACFSRKRWPSLHSRLGQYSSRVGFDKEILAGNLGGPDHYDLIGVDDDEEGVGDLFVLVGCGDAI